MSRERQSEGRTVHRRSRSLSFNSQSFGTAVPECPRVVRKIPWIVFIQLRRRRLQSSVSSSVSFRLSLSLSPSSLPLRSNLVSATIFSSFQNRLRREDNGLHHRATRRSARKRSHRSRSNGSNRRDFFVLADHFARVSSEAFLSRNFHLEEFIAY